VRAQDALAARGFVVRLEFGRPSCQQAGSHSGEPLQERDLHSPQLCEIAIISTAQVYDWVEQTTIADALAARLRGAERKAFVLVPQSTAGTMPPHLDRRHRKPPYGSQVQLGEVVFGAFSAGSTGSTTL
jgi:hypothetical protein